MAARKPFLLRVSPELLEELRGWANQEMRSLNGQIEWILRQALRDRGRIPRDEKGGGGKRSRDSDQN
ncbi:MAG: type II toxin-antitoxin system antitoxin [Planctomycetota bacterium]